MLTTKNSKQFFLGSVKLTLWLSSHTKMSSEMVPSAPSSSSSSGQTVSWVVVGGVAIAAAAALAGAYYALTHARQPTTGEQPPSTSTSKLRASIPHVTITMSPNVAEGDDHQCDDPVDLSEVRWEDMLLGLAIGTPACALTDVA
jgi:hypothetical protein